MRQLSVTANGNTRWWLIIAFFVISVTSVYGDGAPFVAITSPSASTSYASNQSSIDLVGYAWDDIGLTSGIWENDAGGSGTFSPSHRWVVPGIELSSGLNIIKVAVKDTAGKVSEDSIAVVYAPREVGRISEAKNFHGQYIFLKSKQVSAVYADCIYIQDFDRTAGIKVRPIVMPRRLFPGDRVDVAGLVTLNGGEPCIQGAVNAPFACDKRLLVVCDDYSMAPQAWQMCNGVVLTALSYGMPQPTVVRLNQDGTLPDGVRESDYDGCVLIAPGGATSGAAGTFLATPRSSWPLILVMTFYAVKPTQGAPATGMVAMYPNNVESAAYWVNTTSGNRVKLYFRTYTHHIWDGFSSVIPVVYRDDRYYVWICNPVPSNPSNTNVMYSTLGTVNGWCSQPLELALYANRMGWNLAPVVLVPVVDDPKQYMVPEVRHCVREVAGLFRLRRNKLIVAWNNQDVDYNQVGNEGVNPDLVDGYRENSDVFSFILHDHPGLREGDLGLTDLHDVSGRSDNDVNSWLDAQLAIATVQLGGTPVNLHYKGLFLNAENKISLDGIRIAYMRGCSEVRGLCRVRVDTNIYNDVYKGFVRSGEACMPVYPSSGGCGSSSPIDGQNWWLFRAEGTTRYVNLARSYAACVESLLQAVVTSRIGKVCTWGHGINLAASRQGFIALKSQPTEGETVTISSGDQSRIYEFCRDLDPAPPRIRVQIGPTLNDTAKSLLEAIRFNQPDVSVYPKVVASNDGYQMILLTNLHTGDPIAVTTTVSHSVAEPVMERKLLYDYLVNSVFALTDACEGQIRVLE